MGLEPDYIVDYAKCASKNMNLDCECIVDHVVRHIAEAISRDISLDGVSTKQGVAPSSATSTNHHTLSCAIAKTGARETGEVTTTMLIENRSSGKTI